MWITCNILLKKSKRLPPQQTLTQQACKIIKNQRAVLLTRKLIRANTRIIRQKDNPLVQTKSRRSKSLNRKRKGQGKMKEK